jgi:hypothetical protein
MKLSDVKVGQTVRFAYDCNNQVQVRYVEVQAIGHDAHIGGIDLAKQEYRHFSGERMCPQSECEVVVDNRQRLIHPSAFIAKGLSPSPDVLLQVYKFLYPEARNPGYIDRDGGWIRVDRDPVARFHLEGTWLVVTNQDGEDAYYQAEDGVAEMAAGDIESLINHIS